MGAFRERPRLLLENRSFAMAVARNIWKNLPKHLDLRLIEAFAEVGLMRAAEQFNPVGNRNFRPHAYVQIRSAVFQGLMEWVEATKRQNSGGC